MKVTKYQTNGTFFLRSSRILPSDVMAGGVEVIEVAEEPAVKEFRGLGVALTGSSCYNLNLMSEAERSAFLKSIYSESGLNLSVARLTVGSSDYSAELYSYDDTDGDTELSQFSVGADDRYIVPMIQEVLKAHPDLFVYASPWSPPGWMKTGGSMCGGYMREAFIDCYAEYILRYLSEYEKRGIRVSALTTQNETETDQSGKMPACIWHPEIEAKYVVALKKKLEERGMDARVWMHDHNFVSWRKILWQLDHCPGLSEKCDGVAFHYYDGKPEDIGKVREEYPSLEYHFTEGGPNLYNNYATDWCKWGIVVSRALKQGCATFTGWNLILDETGGPNIGPFFCGGLVTRAVADGALSYSGQYHAFAHFSKYIKKGAEIYDADTWKSGTRLAAYPKTQPKAEVLAASNADGTFVLVITNPGTDKCQLQYQRDGKWWYIEALPDSVTTVVFEDDGKTE